MGIIYSNTIDSLDGKEIDGFFVGWPEHPDQKTHLEILRRSYAVWMAFDENKCVGFVNAISDGSLSAFIPLLEVLPEYQGQGIGTELLRRMVETLEGMYSIDIVCDEAISRFYAKKGFSRRVGMGMRNYANQRAANIAEHVTR